MEQGHVFGPPQFSWDQQRHSHPQHEDYKIQSYMPLFCGGILHNIVGALKVIFKKIGF